jgi:hypothetical protein
MPGARAHAAGSPSALHRGADKAATVRDRSGGKCASEAVQEAAARCKAASRVCCRPRAGRRGSRPRYARRRAHRRGALSAGSWDGASSPSKSPRTPTASGSCRRSASSNPWLPMSAASPVNSSVSCIADGPGNSIGGSRACRSPARPRCEASHPACASTRPQCVQPSRCPGSNGQTEGHVNRLTRYVE